MKVVDLEKLKFIDYLIKNDRTPTAFRLAMFDEIITRTEPYTLSDIQNALQSKGHKAHNNSVYDCGKVLAWCNVIEKVVVEDEVDFLVWRFRTRINELKETA